MPQSAEGVRAAKAAAAGGAGENGHACGHGKAMGHGVSGAAFYGVPHRVAEVQKSAAAGVIFIRLHQIALYFHAGGDHPLHGGVGQGGKQRFAGEHGAFDHLGAAVFIFIIRQSGQQRRVTQHQSGLGERPHLIFAAGEVHTGLAAHGGVHHG